MQQTKKKPIKINSYILVIISAILCLSYVEYRDYKYQMEINSNRRIGVAKIYKHVKKKLGVRLKYSFSDQGVQYYSESYISYIGGTKIPEMESTFLVEFSSQNPDVSFLKLEFPLDERTNLDSIFQIYYLHE